MKKSKTSVFFSVIVTILLLVVIVSLLHSCRYHQSQKTNSGMILDSSAEEYIPDYTLATENSNGISIPGYGTIYFPEDETNVQITLYNPEQNDCLFRFELYIDNEKNPIADTGLIESGKAVQNLTLSHPLKAGEYKLNIKVLPYTTDTHTPLNNALVYAKLYVLANK
ncbi:MAG: hypothetical protein U0L17_01785 [Acutalibacteraceae bacterium]|nr:hypothetical protein [Acutalibacteraceae bacterium]